MKLFLKNVVLFLAVSLSLFVLEFIALTYANNKQLANFKVDPTVESITVGDSHAQLAINDRLLPNNMNLSQRGDPFNYSLLKINMILKKKPSIKRIYLGFSYHNLSSYYDDYISGKYSAGIASRYLFILSNREKLITIKENITDLSTLMRLAFTCGLGNIRSNKNRFSFLGSYDNAFTNTKATRKQIDRRLAEQFYENGKIREFSASNSFYLDEIIRLCKKQGVELVVLNTPLHQYYKSKVPAKYVEKYNSLIAQHKLRLIDFNDLALEDNCFAPDGDHVSEKGATLTTNRLMIDESTTVTALVER